MTGLASPSGRTRPYVGVVGPSEVSTDVLATANALGRLLPASGAVVVTGGLGGAMAAATRGAAESGGITVGLLPGTDRADANPWVGVALPTGLGELRNALLVRCAELTRLGLLDRP